MTGWKWLIIGCFLGAGIYGLVPTGAHEFRWNESSVGHPQPRIAVRGLPDFTELVERVGPAVVNVTTRSSPKEFRGSAEHHFGLYKSMFGDDDPARNAVVGLGSGFILRDDGYILTNAHVVAGADEVYVKLTGRRSEVRAMVIGVDAATDIALLKIDAARLPVVRPGSSRSLKVGDWVAAIGSPFGFDNTITAGIVSAKGRRLSQSAETSFLQSDVAINPGSSGGPLVNLSGEVVGINSKIYTRTGGYMGVSFAIPIETALAIGDQLRTRARGKL